MVFCHGFSLFNSELSEELRASAADLVTSLETGGLFVFSYSSNLRGGKRARNWREHKIQDVRWFLSSLGLHVEAVYFIDRRLILRFLGKLSFNLAVSRLLATFSRVTGVPGLLVVIGRRQ